MDAISNINQSVATQNAVAANAAKEAAGAPAAEVVEAPAKPSKADSKEMAKPKPKLGKAAAAVEKPAVVEESRKAERDEKLAALRSLATQTQRSFVDGQKAREAKQAADAEVKKLREEADAARKELESATKDPLGWLESKGVKARALAERIAKGENPSEDLKKLQEHIVRLEQDNEKARKEWHDRQKQAEAKQAFENAKKTVLTTFDSGKDKYATLHAVVDGPEELIQEFIALEKSIYESADPDIQAYIASGGTYSIDEVLEALEGKWKKRVSKLTPAQQAAVGTAAEVAAPARVVRKPTLTPGGSSSTGGLPADFKKLSPKEQTKFLADQYRQLKNK